MKIVLASGSPDGAELLSLITEILPSARRTRMKPCATARRSADEVVRLSRLKAEAARQSHPDAVCASARTPW